MQKYTAIILASRDANEFDRIYTLYTLEQGLVRAVAKGARKPTAKLAAHLEPVTLSEVYVARSRGIGQITSAITLENFDNIKKDFEKLQKVLEIFDFFKKFFNEEEKDKRIFSLLLEFLSKLDKAEWADKAEIIIEAFWWKLFDLLGQKPEVLKCVKCQGKIPARQDKKFDIPQGGVLCPNCAGRKREEMLPVSDNQIKFLRLIFSNSLEALQKIKINSTELAKLEITRKGYLNYHFG